MTYNQDINMTIYHGSDTAVIEPKILSSNRLLDFGEVFSMLYESRLYLYLEDEPTKVWHYSVEKLFQLFDEEMNTGKIELPEY